MTEPRDDDTTATPESELEAAAPAPNRRGVLAIVALVLLAVIAAGVWVLVFAGGDDDPSSYDDVAETFLTKCRETAPERIASPEDFCQCYFDGVQEALPFDEFLEIDEQVREGEAETPEEVITIQQDCELETAPATTLPPATTATTATAPATTAPPG